MRLNFVSIIILFIGFSCSSDIDLELSDYNKKFVVDGFIENGEFAKVHLTFSSPFLTEYDSISIRNTFLNYAKITIISGSGDEEVLTLHNNKGFIPPFVYRTIKMKGVLGEKYDLIVEVNGRVITSTTSIPSLPNIKKVEMVSVSDSTLIINAVIDDPIDETNFYYSQIRTIHYETQIHPSAFPLSADKSFNGSEYHMKIQRSNQPDPLGLDTINRNRKIPRYEFAASDTVLVKISGIDENSFIVLNGVFIDEINNGNPFSFVNQKTSTNIVGGIGRWTGLATRTFYVF